MTVQVDGAELDVLMGGRESGAGTICTIHPFESMDAALPQLAGSTQTRVICVIRGAWEAPPRRDKRANRQWSAWPTTSRLYGGPSALALG